MSNAGEIGWSVASQVEADSDDASPPSPSERRNDELHKASIQADRDRIGQVVSILIDNVLRYAASGGSLEIAASKVQENVVLKVSDRGAGVSPEDLQRLRDRFWRADQSRARHSGGSGLGLAIAAAICQAHGGSLEFRTRSGGGLVAAVNLPADN